MAAVLMTFKKGPTHNQSIFKIVLEIIETYVETLMILNYSRL